MRYLKTYESYGSNSLEEVEDIIKDILLEVSDDGRDYEVKLIRNNGGGDPLPGIVQIKFESNDSDITSEMRPFDLEDIKDTMIRINDIIPFYHANFYLCSSRFKDGADKALYRERPFLHIDIGEVVNQNHAQLEKFEDLFTDDYVTSEVKKYGILSATFFIKPEIVRSL